MRKPKNFSNYLISNSTYLIMSEINGDRVQTIVHEKQGVSKIEQHPLKLVRHTCRLHGTSYEGAVQMAKLFFGPNRHKLPIVMLVEYGNPCVFFPLFSPHSPSNIWINLHAIINIQEAGDETIVTLSNHTEVKLPLHCKSFNQQYVRAMMYYKFLMRSRNS